MQSCHFVSCTIKAFFCGTLFKYNSNHFLNLSPSKQLTNIYNHPNNMLRFIFKKKKLNSPFSYIIVGYIYIFKIFIAYSL